MEKWNSRYKQRGRVGGYKEWKYCLEKGGFMREMDLQIFYCNLLYDMVI